MICQTPIHDLPDSSDRLSLRIFADDTNFFFTGNAKEVKLTMNDESKLILEYRANIKLPANPQTKIVSK